MNFKYEAIVKEVPVVDIILEELYQQWSERWVEELQNIKFKKVDGNLLLMIPNGFKHDTDFYSISNGSHVFICNKDNILNRVTREIWKQEYGNSECVSNGETVIEAVADVENIDDIKYIIVFQYGINEIEDNTVSCDSMLYIYKVPKTMNLRKIIERYERDAHNKVKNEIENNRVPVTLNPSEYVKIGKTISAIKKINSNIYFLVDDVSYGKIGNMIGIFSNGYFFHYDNTKLEVYYDNEKNELTKTFEL